MNSLQTGKNTGNLQVFAPENAHSSLQATDFVPESSHSGQNVTGDYQGHIRE
jgi:hypothetical protein